VSVEVKKMPSEDSYLKSVRQRWPRAGQQPTVSLLNTFKRALRACPWSSELWLLYARLIQLWDIDSRFTAEDCLAACSRAVDCDPGSAEAHEEMGFVLDIYCDDFQAAEKEFRLAIALKGGVYSYFGLARVLAEIGRSSDAISLLRKCPFSENTLLIDLVEEIECGMWTT